MAFTDLLTYYSDRLIIQYRSKTKAIQTVQLFVNASVCDGLVQQEQTCFDLDTATGAQLDILGKIVGVPRNILGLDLVHTFFSFTRYAGSPASVGFGRYTDNPYPSDLFLRYYSDATYTMSDFEMLAVIKMKIQENVIRSSYKNLIEGMWGIFGTSVGVVETAFTLTYNVKQPYYNTFSVAQYLNILPKPMGIAVVVNQI